MMAWPGVVSVSCSLVGEARGMGPTERAFLNRIVSRYFTDYRINNHIHRLPDGPYPAITTDCIYQSLVL